MHADSFNTYLGFLSKALNISVVYGSRDHIISSYQPFSYDGEENRFDFIASRLNRKIRKFHESGVYFDINRYLMLIGIVTRKTRDRDEFVLIGPIASNVSTPENVQSYLFDTGLNTEKVRSISAYLSGNRRMAFEEFLNLLASVFVAMNEAPIATTDFTDISDKSIDSERFAQNSRDKNDALLQEGDGALRDRKTGDEFTKKVRYIMRHGLVNLLPQLYEEMANSPAPEANEYSENPLTNARLTALGALFSGHGIIVESGVPLQDADNLKYYYLRRIELAKREQEFYALSGEMLEDFTKAVHDATAYTTANPAINRVVRYIQDNIQSKLTVEMIAGALRLNQTYLYVNFKKEIGMTPTEFITKEKIRKAKYYLIFTDRSLIEIADYLSFSSQNYFQAVFKKETGMTPNRYRQARAARQL